jgi:hypothetical protein
MGPYNGNPKVLWGSFWLWGPAGLDDNAKTSAEPTFQQKSSQPTAIIHTRSLLILLFIISQWVYQMIIQGPVGIMLALGVLPGWMTMPRPLLKLALLAQLFSKNPPDQQP